MQRKSPQMKSAKKSTQETMKFNRQNVIDNVARLKSLANAKFDPKAGRLDFYEYLGEVYRWVMGWKAAKKVQLLRTSLAKLIDEDAEEPRVNARAFHMVIDLTCPRKKGPKSKFAIALWNAQQAGVLPHELVSFLREIGGPTTIYTRLSKKLVEKQIREAKNARKKSARKKGATKKSLKWGCGSMARTARKGRAKTPAKSKERVPKRNATSKVWDDREW